MEKLRVLVANDPRVYREVIAHGLKEVRPHIEVSTAEPEDLDREVAHMRPHLVICSRITTDVQAGCLAWVVLYPEGENLAKIGGNGRGHMALLATVGANDLLWVVDETEHLYRSSHKDEPLSDRTVRSRSEVGQTGSKLPRRTS